MGKIILLLVAASALGGGLIAGQLLRADNESDHANPEEQAGPLDGKQTEIAPDPKHNSTSREYLKLNNQFVVPLIQSGRVESLVILSLSLEIEGGSSETIYAMEPKLRGSFLQHLFDYANAGGFAGSFTGASSMNVLRSGLLEIAQHIAGTKITDVLISDIVRQDS